MRMITATAAVTLSDGMSVAALLVVTLLGAGMVSGQDYPNKTIRILAAGAGSGGDFTARLLAPGLA